MTIGLSSDEMFEVVWANALSRIQGLTGQVAASKVGENPEMAASLQLLQQQYPEISPLAYFGLTEVVKAVLDAVAANNQAISKVVPHVESS